MRTIQKSIKRLIVCGLFVGTMASSQAFAQSAATNILQMVQEGDFDGARATLAKTPHGDIDALYLEAQILTRQGRPGEAVKIYRAILAVQPGQIEIRQILAQTLFQMGDFEAARFHFRELLETDRREGVKQQYAAALRRIEQNTPSGVGASFAIVPSSNINRGTTNTYVQSDDPTSGTISESGKATSGVGLQFGVNGFYKIPRAQGGLYTLTASATQVLYSETVYNVFQPTLAIRFENGNEAGIWSWEVFARRTYRRDRAEPSGIIGIPDRISNSSANSFGLSVSGRRALSGPNILTYSTSVQQTQYDSLTNQDGPTASFKLGIQRNMSNTTAVNAGVSLGRGLPQGDSFKYRSAGIDVGISNTWKGGWATYAGAGVGLRWYDANFGFTGMKRNDRYLTLTASVLNSTLSWNGFSPRVTCNWQSNASNIGFYDYDATECNVLMTRGF